MLFFHGYVGLPEGMSNYQMKMWGPPIGEEMAEVDSFLFATKFMI